jgi:hypothetical protein
MSPTQFRLILAAGFDLVHGSLLLQLRCTTQTVSSPSS